VLQVVKTLEQKVTLQDALMERNICPLYSFTGGNSRSFPELTISSSYAPFI